MAQQFSRKALGLSIFIITFSTFTLSCSIGMNNIILPYFMEESPGYSESMTSFVLAAEFAAALGLCFAFPKFIKKTGLIIFFLIAAIIRTAALYIMSEYESPASWLFFSLFLGFGNFSGLLVLQTWVNSLPRVKLSGLVTACYGTAISVGVAAAPFVLKFFGFEEGKFSLSECPDALKISTAVTFSALIPILLAWRLKPEMPTVPAEKISTIVKENLNIMLIIVICGASFYGVSSYIVIYGMKNNIDPYQAALLLSAFMLGSLCLETLLTTLTDFFNRMTLVMLYVMTSMLCAVCLPMLIYEPWAARVLLFVWGGITGGLFSTALTMTGEKFEKGDQVSANSAITLSENIGALSAVLIIGNLMASVGSDGLPYTILFFCTGYISYIMISYKVK